MKGFRSILYIVAIGILFPYCNVNQKSSVDLEFAAIQGLINGAPSVFYVGDIDMEKTPDCGRATADATGGAGQQPGGGGQQPIRTQNTTQTQIFSILSTFNFKNTLETLNLRFTYDKRQFRGPVNPQQGFVLTGGFFGNTVTGRQGTVEWGPNGILLAANQSNQQLQFMHINLDLVGTFVPGVGSAVPPNQCFTQDNVNCTAIQTSTQCFTQDNRTCLADAGLANGAKQIIIRGKIRCNAPQIF